MCSATCNGLVNYSTFTKPWSKRFIKPVIFIIAFICCSLCIFSQTKISGGEIRYEYQGTNPVSHLNKYRIDLNLFQSCPNDEFPEKVDIFVYKKGDYSKPVYRIVDLPRTSRLRTITPANYDLCVYNIPEVCFIAANYYAIIFLPGTAEGMEIFCFINSRENGITNIFGGQTAGYIASIPGNAVDTTAHRNSSPDFFKNEAVIACANNPFSFDVSARDAEGDSIEYFLCSGQSGSAPNGGITPFSPLSYSGSYSGSNPMGIGVKIDQQTGIISGIAPAAGKYLVTVCALEYRKGIPISVNRKEFLIKVSDCSIARAELPEKTMGCRSFTVSFANKGDNPLVRSYRWDFGVVGSSSDTSSLANPSFTFPDTGVYRARLIINEGVLCDDTAYTDVYVYPGMQLDYRMSINCIFPGMPIRFTNLSTSAYGTIDYWRWDFGQIGEGGINELSAEQHPRFNGYKKSDTFHIELWVGTNLGCIDTLRRDVVILSTDMLQLTNDTTICIGDTLQLHARGDGTVQWTPAYRISDVTSSDPVVFPDIGTRYDARLTLNSSGCIINKSVFVDAKRFITVDAGADTTVCLRDTFQLHSASDALKFRWSPAATLDNPYARNPNASPTGNTRYIVVANTGSCIATDSIDIVTVPYPTIAISPDTVLCYGDKVQLRASGGISYQWSPAIALSNTSIANPFASPVTDITYQVAVIDNKGCPKPGFGKITINSIPPVKAFAGYDTAIIAGQPLQLKASGSLNYSWSPAIGLNNSFIPDPIAIISDNITYRVRASTEEGCYGYDEIKVKVFRTLPEIFVPNAFTPNGDGKNDQIRPTPVGIKQFHYFRVYNRWGQLIYSTSTPTIGWDGRFAGRTMDANTYVWESKGIDYTGKTILKRGSFILIR